MHPLRFGLALAVLCAATAAAAGERPGLRLQASSLPGGGGPFAVVTADLNRDGHVDIATTNLAQVTIYLGKGDGTFAVPAALATGSRPRGIVAADFNRDGTLDLGAAATGQDALVLHLGRGDGTFQAGQFFPIGQRPFLASSADLNADGIPDIAVANEAAKVSILLGDGRGGFAVQSYATNKWPSATAIGDFDGDGHQDVAVTNWGANNVSILFGKGDGTTFSAPRNFTFEGHSLYCVLAADIDRDGHLDMVWNDILRSEVYLLYGDGHGAFPRTARLEAAPGVRSVVAADLTGDGWLDLASANTSGGNVSIMLADGRGGFFPTQQVPAGASPRMVTAADLDQDQRLDLIVTNTRSDTVTVLLNRGLTQIPEVEEIAGPPATRRSLSFSGLERPNGIAFDRNGDLLVSDQGHHRIARVALATGTITTAIGTGVAGDSGDGGPADLASLNQPYAIAVDAAGAVYIADTGNHRIRKVDTAGNVSSIAGTGVQGFSGDGGPADRAQLNQPIGLAVDATGTIFVSELSGRIRKIDGSGIITTIAGTGLPAFSGDGGPASAAAIGPIVPLAVDPAGNLLLADQLNRRIRRIDAAGQIATLVGGTAPASGAGTDADIGMPGAVAADPQGNVYFPANGALRRLSAEGRIEILAGGPKDLLAPSGMAVGPDGALYFADPQCNCIRRTSAGSALQTVAGEGPEVGRDTSGPSSESATPAIPDARLHLEWEHVFRSGSDANTPYAIAVGGDRSVYVAGDIGSGADWLVMRLSPDGQPGWQFNSASKAIDVPTGLVSTADGQLVSAGHSMSNGRDYLVIALAQDGTERWRYAPVRDGDQVGWSVAADAASNLYIAGESSGQWEVFSLAPDGTLRWTATDDRSRAARGIAVDAQGDLLVAGDDGRGWRVAKLDPSGALKWQHRARAKLASVATAIAVDGAGNSTVTGDWGDRSTRKLRVERLDPDGKSVWAYVDPESVIGHNVAVDAAGNTVVIGDTDRDWVMLGLDPSGHLQWRFTHDGGGGVENMDQAFGLALQPDGFLVSGFVHPVPPSYPSRGAVNWRIARYRLERP